MEQYGEFGIDEEHQIPKFLHNIFEDDGWWLCITMYGEALNILTSSFSTTYKGGSIIIVRCTRFRIKKT